MATVIVAPYEVASFPEGGGHFWVYMQYIHALRRAGCEVYWLEQFQPRGDAAAEERALAVFFERARAFGLAGHVLLYAPPADGAPRRWLDGSAPGPEAILRRSDLLLNFHYAIAGDLLALPRRTALVDIDPGLLQVWISGGQMVVHPHDVYFTIGETVGTAAARFPDCGLRWLHITPPVCLDLWPCIDDPPGEMFTTVANWWGKWLKEVEDGREVLRENTKRVGFAPFVDLPQHTSQPLELALNLADSDADQRGMLEQRGWRVRHARDVTATPEAYRAYLQRSRGEFSAAKPAYVRFQNAWVSDRTVCYLASGRPVVVQDTGPSTFLPKGEGMLRFTTVAEAAAALEAVNSDYERHHRAARALAETHFDARRVIERILDAALS